MLHSRLHTHWIYSSYNYINHNSVSKKSFTKKAKQLKSKYRELLKFFKNELKKIKQRSQC